MPLECNLTTISNVELADICKPDNIDFSKIGLNKKEWVTTENSKPYVFVKYIKSAVTLDNICSLGLFRSVLLYDGQIKIFSPPKSLKVEIFTSNFKPDECNAEEFVEGTMINLFYDDENTRWEIASKSCVSGNVKYFKDQPTFKELFYEICSVKNLDFSNLPKDNSYSFVLQHPKNRFVIPIVNKRLVLVAVYHIDGYAIKELECADFIKYLNNVELPYKQTFSNYAELETAYCSVNTPYTTMGVMIKHSSGIHTKMRNPNYESLKMLRGNSPKLQYQYLSLRSSRNVENFLTFFPENKDSFEQFRKQVHEFTKNLHKYYVKCFIKKELALKDAPFQFKPHLYNLHQKYLAMIGTGGIITKVVVIEYINTLHPAKLMHSVNYALYGLAGGLN